MPASLSAATLTPIVQILGGLDGVIAKGEAHARARKIDPDTILFARLYPDMFHFARQVQTACDFGMKVAARLTGREPQKLERNEKTFAELHALVASSIAYVAATDAAAVDAANDVTITVPMGERQLTMTGADYAHRFALPNFYFHATMAYAILRENGVEVSKMDYMGRMTG